jgi:hypothetical protein
MLSSVACLTGQHFSTLSHKWQDIMGYHKWQDIMGYHNKFSHPDDQVP